MNSKLPGLDESETMDTPSSEVESSQPQLVDASESSDGGAVSVEHELPVTETSAEAGDTEELSPAALELDTDSPDELVTTEEDAAPTASDFDEPVTYEEHTEPIDTDFDESVTSEEGSWLPEEGADSKRLRRGDVIEATVTTTSPTAVYVDVGGKSDGIIPGRELERMTKDMLDMLRPGEKISVYVVNPHDHNGDVILSLNRALEELDWRRAEEFRESQEVYESHVAGYNKGGLIVRFGRVRGFVPQSQLGPDRRRGSDTETPEERWGKMVNEPIAVKVMEVDRSRNRLILSERAAARESRETRKESLINRLQVGEVRTGKVVSLVDFGAFVDVGGAEGLVHLTELSWTHVNHPRELLKVGQEVKVEIISIDADSKRIGLSMKRQEADPWDTVAINYAVGQLVQGIVTKLTKFGAFTRLVDVPEIEGLVHISELSDQRVNHPREVLNEGETVTLRVVKMDIENRRLGLSLKRVNSAEYLDMDWFTGGDE